MLLPVGGSHTMFPLDRVSVHLGDFVQGLKTRRSQIQLGPGRGTAVRQHPWWRDYGGQSNMRSVLPARYSDGWGG